MDPPAPSVYKASVVVSSRSSLVSWLALALVLVALPGSARADGQLSVRNVFGAGKRWADVVGGAVFEAALVGDVMFGKPEPEKLRIGPTFELRTIDFDTLEGAAGAGVLIPLPGDFPIGLNGLVGYAARNRAPDTPMGIGTLTWGYRGYNFHHWYGWALNVYVSARKSLAGQDVSEVTGGVQLDIMFTTIIPILSVRNFILGGDPHEP